MANPLQLNETELAEYNRAGRFHALHYPVSITGALVPYHPVRKLLNKGIGFKSFTHFLNWMGLAHFPQEEGSGPYFIPFRIHRDAPFEEVTERVGLTRGFNKDGAEAMTFSCAACHSSQLFGKVVMGLQNRFPNANRVYVMGDRALRTVPTPIFRTTTGASKAEAEMYRRTRKNMKFVEARDPQNLGLDTSLAHTALSLSHRKKDDIASKDSLRGTLPRGERLRLIPGDSKPGTWWNVKYKNRWLLDGSVVSGNPIFTNILWNEIGRGSDLEELEVWLDENQKTIDELTTAVYASEAPHITDFIDARDFDLESAVRGQKLYRKLNCNKCHGDYLKNWELGDASQFSDTQLLKTYQVLYHEKTPVKDVGTDVHRYQAMESLVQLNDLRISKKNGARIEPQKGYVPPPLVGIWARWPYFHNNSVPSLCDVLTPENQRPKKYWAGPAKKIERDFDLECNGYPMGSKTPANWKKDKKYLYNTSKRGMSNKGHSDRILVRDGKLRFNEQEKRDLVRFLQTL